MVETSPAMTSLGLLFEPQQHITSVTRRVGDGIEHSVDPSIADDEGEARETDLFAGSEAWQPECRGEASGLIAQDWKRQRQARHQLLLIVRRLTAQAEQANATMLELRMMVAEALELGRRAMRASDVVPAGRIGLTGAPGPGMDNDEASPGKSSKVDIASIRRGK